MPALARPFLMPVLLLLGIALLMIVAFGRIPAEGRWVPTLQNAAHGPVFALLTLVVMALLRRAKHPPGSVAWQYGLTLLLILVLGVFLEWFQGVTGREASVSDVVRNMLGALAALGFFAVVDSRIAHLEKSRPLRGAAWLVGLISTGLVAAPAAMTGSAYLQRFLAFPILADFDSKWTDRFVAVYSAARIEHRALPELIDAADHPATGLRAEISVDRGWAIALWEPWPDWRGYQRLVFDIVNPTDSPLHLRVHIRDRNQSTDRRSGYQVPLEFPPRSRVQRSVGLHQLATAAGRARVDTRIVNSVVLKRSPENRAGEFYLVRIRLE